MKKITALLTLLCAIAFAQEDNTVAVYMAGKEPVGAKGAHKMVGGELVKAISKSGKYSAINRTDEILKVIAKEHGYQRSGAVSDEQIKTLGQQLGVQYLCIAEISDVKGGTFYLDVRLVDVVTAKTINAATATSALKNNSEMMAVAQQVARELVSVKAGMITLGESDILLVTERLEKERFELFYGESVKSIDHTQHSFVDIPKGAMLEVFYINPAKDANTFEVRIVKATIKVVNKNGTVTQRDSEDDTELTLYFIPKRYITADFLYYTLTMPVEYLGTKLIKLE